MRRRAQPVRQTDNLTAISEPTIYVIRDHLTNYVELSTAREATSCAAIR
jgi:hypothetical protein